MKKFPFVVLFVACYAVMIPVEAQPVKPLYVKDTKQENRNRLYKSLVAGINRDLSLPLTDSTEENYMDAFYSIELLRYHTAWTENCIRSCFSGLNDRSVFFKRSLAEVVYAMYPHVFIKEMQQLLNEATDAKLYAVCAEYLLRAKPDMYSNVLAQIMGKPLSDSGNAIVTRLRHRLQEMKAPAMRPPVKDLLQHRFFDKAVVVFSFQRKNRDYPGITLVRDSAGNFIRDISGNLFYVKQLCRSISNLPGYISNGNTPQGIFRMDGFEVSKSIFIGPTPNIQLTMPIETSIRHFMNDSTVADSVWTDSVYRSLLPASWKNYLPFYEAYYAGAAGRTEIIAHGTTVDPVYYKSLPCYPLTPTLGCLCTTEFWNPETGLRSVSDQQLLVDAVQRGGGAKGYYIVIELDDEQRAVSVDDLLLFLK